MTIEATGVRVRVPLVRPFTTAAGAWSTHDAWLVGLRGGDGRVGVGEAALDPLAPQTALAELATRVRAVVERSWWEPGDLAAALDDPDALDGPGRAARSAVEAALVDGGWLSLVGRPGGSAVPGAATGPAPFRVPLNATIDAVDPDAAVAGAQAAIAAGFATLKLKAPSDEPAAALAARIAAVRAAVGAAVRLRLDANGAWSLAEAAARLAAVAPLGLEYVEQPVASLEAMAELRRRVDVPLAADELVASPAAAAAVLDAGAADVLVVKPARVGGPLVALGIARTAAGCGVPTVVSTLLETGVGLLAGLRVAAALDAGLDTAVSLAHGLATADLLVDDLVLDPPAIRDGSAVVRWPVGAGRVDDEAVRRFAVDVAGSSW
jgi:L-alanine-DL-glutamate epimerase-like enolase superfamily enzyme